MCFTGFLGMFLAVGLPIRTHIRTYIRVCIHTRAHVLPYAREFSSREFLVKMVGRPFRPRSKSVNFQSPWIFDNRLASSRTHR